MHPVIFEVGSFTIYSYGLCIAVGAILGFTYMTVQGKKEFNLSFDQSNTLFLLIVISAVLGGKLFLLFEDISYLKTPSKLLSGSGFVFYGSLIACIPTMLWFFKRNNIPVWSMLDVMAVVTVILHACGRIGCFMAGCCYGLPTDSFPGVIFTDPLCQAEPLNTALHATQLYESAYLLLILCLLLIVKNRKQFSGQLFLLYIILYSVGRSVIEIFRGDISRGFVIDGILSNSQFISALLCLCAAYFYVRRRNLTLGASKASPDGK